MKELVVNNQWLGMARQWQDMIYDKHRSGSDLSNPMAVKRPGEAALAAKARGKRAATSENWLFLTNYDIIRCIR